MPDLDSGALIAKHRAKGALVDANLLVLFLVGALNRRRIPEFERAQDFTIEDFELLRRLIDWFGKLIATPQVLSQVSPYRSSRPGTAQDPPTAGRRILRPQHRTRCRSDIRATGIN